MTGVIAVPTVAVGVPIADAAIGGVTVQVKVALAARTNPSLAVTVTDWLVTGVVRVPEMTPLAGSIVRPSGRLSAPQVIVGTPVLGCTATGRVIVSVFIEF